MQVPTPRSSLLTTLLLPTVLADCGDTISRVHYVRHDVADPLPFADASFDVFTSTVSLPLIGLGP